MATAGLQRICAGQSEKQEDACLLQDSERGKEWLTQGRPSDEGCGMTATESTDLREPSVSSTPASRPGKGLPHTQGKPRDEVAEGARGTDLREPSLSTTPASSRTSRATDSSKASPTSTNPASTEYRPGDHRDCRHHGDTTGTPHEHHRHATSTWHQVAGPLACQHRAPPKRTHVLVVYLWCGGASPGAPREQSLRR